MDAQLYNELLDEILAAGHEPAGRDKQIALLKKIYEQGKQDGHEPGRIDGREEMRAELRELLGLEPVVSDGK